MDVVQIIKQIHSTTATIAKAARMARSNKNRCRRLSDRVETISGFITKTNPNREMKRELPRTIEVFLNILSECQIFVEQFSSQKWFQRAFRVKKTNEAFNTLNLRLSTSTEDLNLGINVESIFDRSNDENDINRDAIDMERIKNEIVDRMGKDDGDVKTGLEDIFKTRLISMKYNFLKEIKEVVRHDQSLLSENPVPFLGSGTQKGDWVATCNLDLNEIHFYDFNVTSRIGSGEFGEVYKALWTTCGQIVAVKKLRTSDFSIQFRKQFADEIRILRKIQFENVVTFYDVCIEPGNCYLIIEFMDKGSLYDVIHSDEEITWTRRWEFALQMARAITFLHQMRPPILHGNITSFNFLVNSKNVVKVSDFGLSSVRLGSQTSQSSRTIHCVAPERLAESGTIYDEKCDIYSLGMVMWELATRDTPYVNRDDNMMRTEIRLGGRPSIPECIPEGFRSIIEACWHHDPERRPGGRDLIFMIRVAMKKGGIKFHKMKIDTSKTESESSPSSPSSISSINFHIRTPSLTGSINLHNRVASISTFPESLSVNFHKNSIKSTEWNNVGEIPLSSSNLRPIVENPLEAQLKESNDIFKLMKLHSHDPESLDYYLAQLSNMCLDEKEPYRFINADGVGTILSSMRTRFDSIGVQEKGLSILWSLAKSSGIVIFGDEDLEIIWDNVRRFPNSQMVQESGIKIAWNTTLIFGDKRITEVHLKIILGMTRTYQKDQKVQERSMGVILCICGVGHNRDLIVENDGINLVLIGIQNHPKSQAIQEKGCGILSSLSFEKNNRIRLIETGVIRVVLNTVRMYPRDQNIQFHAYGILTNLSFDNVATINSIMREDPISLIVDSLKTFCRFQPVQKRGCALLWNLSAIIDNVAPIMRKGGIVVLLDALKNNQHNPLVLEYSCGALWNLSVSPGVRAVVLRKAGIKLILDTIRISQVHPLVQHRASGFLLNMCYKKKSRNITIDEKGIDVILECLRHHPVNPSIQSIGAQILKKLATNSNSRAAIVGSGGSEYLT